MKLAGIRWVEDLVAEGGGLQGKRVFVRVDFNVPQDKKTGQITDDARIREAIPTIKLLMDAGAKVILASHLGRPKPGKRDLTLEPVGARLAQLTGYEVLLPEDCVGDAPKKIVHDLRAGQICLLENLRFHEEEEKDDDAFARQLAELCDAYVDDAFGAVHRAHASVHALPLLVRRRAAGLLLHKELSSLARLTDRPEKPYVAVLGGAKVSDKIDVVEALLGVVDTLAVGGAMANTFLAALGKNMGASRVEEDKLPLARTILARARDRKVEVLLPVDVVVASGLDATTGEAASIDAVPAGTMALDVGPKTVELFGAAVTRAKTVFWNGPMGPFETPAFSRGTMALARIVGEAPGFTVVGGGDSAAAVKQAGPEVMKGVSHISTGGGAALELIEGKRLPGVEALRVAEVES
jgi:phosphoglycerate kinase